jgi:hypothetical protein
MIFLSVYYCWYQKSLKATHWWLSWHHTLNINMIFAELLFLGDLDIGPTWLYQEEKEHNIHPCEVTIILDSITRYLFAFLFKCLQIFPKDLAPACGLTYTSYTVSPCWVKELGVGSTSSSHWSLRACPIWSLSSRRLDVHYQGLAGCPKQKAHCPKAVHITEEALTHNNQLWSQSFWKETLFKMAVVTLAPCASWGQSWLGFWPAAQPEGIQNFQTITIPWELASLLIAIG